METRLDRIEKALETLLVGIAELKESRKKTDEQLSRTDAQILERKGSQKKTDTQMLELKESQKKTDEQMRRTDEQIRRTDAKLDRVGKQLADQRLVQGEATSYWVL
jgi:septal ring factor EnvC (AmiA/AmiB activator)